MKRILKYCIFLATIVCILAGCGAEKVESESLQVEKIISRETVVLGSAEGLYAAHTDGERLYGCITENGEHYLYIKGFVSGEEKRIKLNGVDADKILKEIYISDDDVSCIFTDNMGIYLAKGDMNGDMEPMRKLTGEGLDGVLVPDAVRYRVLANGESELVFEAPVKAKNLEQVYVSVLNPPTDDVAFRTSNWIMLDESGEVQVHQRTLLSVSYEQSASMVGSACVNGEEYILLKHFNEPLLSINKVGSNGQMEKMLQMSVNTEQGFAMCGTPSGDKCYFTDGCKLYTFDVASGQTKEELFLSENGISVQGLKEIFADSSGVLHFIIYDDVKGEHTVLALEEGSVEKTIITLGVSFRMHDAELIRVVDAYNQQSKEYYVKLVQCMNPEEDLDSQTERIYAELLSGKGPDILEMSVLDKQTLGPAGLLEDLKPYLGEDKSDYVENVLTAMETGNKLYTIGPCFSVYTLIADGRKSGTRVGWTMEEMLDFIDGQGGNVHSIYGFSSDEPVITTLGAFSMDDYIDWDEKTCNFQTDEFYHLLEFAKEKMLTPTEYPAKREGIYSGHYLLVFNIFTSVSDYQIANELFGGNLQIKGFPTDNGYSVAAQMYGDLAIYSKGRNKEAAWDFLKYYIANYEDDGFPILKDKMIKELQASMDEQRDPDSGELIPYGVEGDIFVYAATEQDVNAVQGMISLVNAEYHYNTVVLGIIEEEANAYYYSERSAEEVTKNINNRVGLYLEEQK